MTLKERLLPPKPEGEVVNIGQRILQWHSLYTDLTARIDALEAEAVRVYGQSPKEIAGGSPLTIYDRDERDTHTALLINIEPIERGVSAAEIVKFLHSEASYGDLNGSIKGLADRIEREGVKP